MAELPSPVGPGLALAWHVPTTRVGAARPRLVGVLEAGSLVSKGTQASSVTSEAGGSTSCQALREEPRQRLGMRRPAKRTMGIGLLLKPSVETAKVVLVVAAGKPVPPRCRPRVSRERPLVQQGFVADKAGLRRGGAFVVGRGCFDHLSSKKPQRTGNS